MIARLQQAIMILGSLTVFIAASALFISAHPGWACALLVVAILPHPGVLALEFVLLRRLHGSDPTPRARLKELFAAWRGEVITSTKVFGWRQPFRSTQWPDHVPARSEKRGILLVHGYFCNRGLWNPWMARLRRMDTPFIAVNLEPAFGSIDDLATTLEQASKQLEMTTGRLPLVVAHSMGGLAVRAWLARDAARPHRVVTIGTPHLGTWLARLGTSRNARQMQTESHWLKALALSEANTESSRFTCFYSNCDNIVFPPANACLQGADNRHLPGVAHVCLAYHPAPWNEVMRLLNEHQPQ